MKQLPYRGMAWPICWEAVELIALAEGCRLKAYKCPAGVWTCGWGETEGVKPGMEWAQETADKRLCSSLTDYTARVSAMLKDHATPQQLGAMVSLAYNIGLGAFAKSTVLRQHNAGNSDAAARAFGLWNKATVGGVLTPLAGLTARRTSEAALYLKPDDDDPIEKMPQAVASESKIVASPIAQSGAVTAGAGVLSLLSQSGDHLGVVSGTVQKAKALTVETLGVPAGWFLPIVLTAVGAVVVWQRYKQRAGGWA